MSLILWKLRFVTTFRGARHWSWYWSRNVQRTSSHHVSLRFFLILSYCIFLCFSYGRLPSYFPAKGGMQCSSCRWQSKNQSITPTLFALTTDIFTMLVVIWQPVKRSYGRKEHRNMSVCNWLFSTAPGPTQSLKEKASSFLNLTYLQSRMSPCVNKTHLFFPTPRVHFPVFVCVFFYLLNFCLKCCKGGNKVTITHLWFGVVREVETLYIFQEVNKTGT